MTITGYRIGPAPTVTFGTRSATVISQSTDLGTLQVVAPAGATARAVVSVRVTNGDGLSATRPYRYTS